MIAAQKICLVKGQLISECLFDVLNFPKKTISALKYKKWLNQQNKGTFLSHQYLTNVQSCNRRNHG